MIRVTNQRNCNHKYLVYITRTDYKTKTASKEAFKKTNLNVAQMSSYIPRNVKHHITESVLNENDNINTA